MDDYACISCGGIVFDGRAKCKACAAGTPRSEKIRRTMRKISHKTVFDKIIDDADMLNLGMQMLQDDYED
jgi:hypothetical protein